MNDSPLPSGLVAFLFTDVVGSTRWWESAPEVALSELVEEHFRVLRAAVQRVGGAVFSMMGDGVAAAFSTVDAAVEAAVLAQAGLRDLEVPVRMGIHAGPVEVVGGDYRGRAVNRAARVMAVAHGGQVLVSDAARGLVSEAPSGTGWLDLGMHRLRDLDQPMRLWQVTGPGLRASFPPVLGIDSFVSNLPVHRTSFVGREADLARVVALLDAGERLVTLTGVGGVGKTRLAVQVGAEVVATAGAVWLVELAPVADGAGVIGALAVTLGVQPASPNAVVAALMPMSAVLVLDNCEHVLDAAAELVEELTQRCPAVRVVATSREPLGVAGERVVVLRSLGSEPAVELFRERAAAVDAQLGDEDVGVLQAICKRLDGIPLAIELAAAHAGSLGLDDLLVGLNERFDLLAGGRRRVVERHQTLRATVEWSYRLLEPHEQRLFRMCGVFVGGFELDGATGVAAQLGFQHSTVAPLVSRLVHRNLIVALGGSPMRYSMLETLRAYALDVLATHDETDEVAHAHASWLASLGREDFSERWASASGVHSAVRMDREPDNWLAAVTHAVHRGDVDLLEQLSRWIFLVISRPDLLEDAGLRTRMLEAAPSSAIVRTLLAWRAMYQSELGVAAAMLRDVEPLPPVAGNVTAFAWSTYEVLSGRPVAAIDRLVPVMRDAPEGDLRDVARSMAAWYVGIAGLPLATVPAEHAVEARSMLALADRTSSPLVRCYALVAATWLADDDHAERERWTRRTMDEARNLPRFFHTMVISAVLRGLGRHTPARAAALLLDELGTGEHVATGIAGNAYAAAATYLLQHNQHPATATVLATLARQGAGALVTGYGLGDAMADAVAHAAPLDPDDLLPTIRAALTDLVRAG